MKQFTALLCVICILCLTAGALAAPGDAYLFSEDQKDELGISRHNSPAMAAIGDTVYTLWGDSVFAWQTGSDTPEKVASAIPFSYFSTWEDALKELGDEAEYMVDTLLSDNGTLYGFNMLSGKLFPLTFSDGQIIFGSPIVLDWAEIIDQQSEDNYSDLINLKLTDGKLFMLTRSYDDYDNPVLMSFDLATGDKTIWDVSHIQDFAPYRDGKLLVEIYDHETAYDENTGEMANPVLGILDPADGSVTEIGSFGNTNIYGIVYDADADTLYYTTNSMLMAMPALAEAVQVAFIPVDYAGESVACLLPGGLYAINTWDGLFVRNTDPQYMPTTSLSVYGGYIDDAALSFIAEYPDIPLTFNVDTYYSTAAGMAQAMASGDSANDIYNISLSYIDFTGLMEKGYCMDLSPYAALTDKLSALYPFVQAALTNEDGAFCGVPTDMYAYGLGILPDVWKEAGLEDRIPTSFMGFLDFIQWWLDEGMDEYPDLMLIQDVYEYGGVLFALALELYITQYQAEGKELTLDTPVFRAMMEKLEALDIDALNDTVPITQEEMMYSNHYEDYSDVCLFTQFAEWLNVYTNNDYSYPLILSLEEGGERHIPVRIQCMFVNPNTSNADIAAAYLLSSLESIAPFQRIFMFPDENEPVPNEHYQQMVEENETMLADAKASLETAAPEDVKDIQSSIGYIESFLSHKEDYYWLASAETIAAYREIAPLCYTALPNILSYSSNEEGSFEISTLIDRYLQKQMTLDQFITQTDQKIRMIQLEMQ